MRYIPQVLSHRSDRDDWSTRHSVLATARRTAALVNVLAEDLPDPAAVAKVLRDHGETGPLDLTADEVAAMRAAAAMLRPVFAAEHADEAAAALNHLLREHTGPLRLTSHAGTTPWHPHLDRDDDAPWDAWLLASSCMALTVLVWDRQQPPGRICASSACDAVFIARGSGPERRYCSRRCATRERVAAHRRTRTAEGPGEGRRSPEVGAVPAENQR
ncbi:MULTISPECIES: CGNR zinc finger domain-containing protein [Streptomyces]|uniref:CGNR zinc finger domain-containing protein n=1 Tax=Streptomyces TaxID=1883 RepID=UPI0015C413A9|nr:MULTISPECIES: CGNR zinc finger domain-containing protein [Streptomyces]MDW4899821.1 CGNR zinc finger domain-containing protein [Streptomyces californicus]QLG31218.1 CGNR zinc finger domain-containing protein [Streptomyces sp. CB04723]